MMHNEAFALKSAKEEIDYAAIDPASVDWSLFGKSKGNWSSSKKGQDPVVPRVETHAFDPYAQARPELYSFQRDAKEAITYYSQTRLDGKFIGTVEMTATGVGRDSVLRIFWKKNGGADIEFDMVGTNTNLDPICSGYCKKTDLGAAVPGQLGKLGWVVVATKLHGQDIRRSQDFNLFSLPLFEAIATGVAFAIFKDDSTIRDMHPSLGTQAPAAIGDSLYHQSIAGKGAMRWVTARPSDLNSIVVAQNSFTTISVEGFEAGRAMEITPHDTDGSVGAVFPLSENNDAVMDALSVHRIVIGEYSASIKGYEEMPPVMCYRAAAYSNLHKNGDEPVAIVTARPPVGEDANGRLVSKRHETLPLVGTEWIIPGRGEITVSEGDVALVKLKVCPWTPEFMAAIEAAMYKIRTTAQKAYA